MIRDLGDAIGSAVFETVGRALGQTQEHRPLPVDLLENDEAYLAVFDAPGAVPSDVQVRFEDDAIVVRIDRFRDFYEDFEMQFPGRGLELDGRVDLPDDFSVDPTEGTATLKQNGTLHVRVPKTTEESPDTNADTETDNPKQTTTEDGEEPDAVR